MAKDSQFFCYFRKKQALVLIVSLPPRRSAQRRSTFPHCGRGHRSRDLFWLHPGITGIMGIPASVVRRGQPVSQTLFNLEDVLIDLFFLFFSGTILFSFARDFCKKRGCLLAAIAESDEHRLSASKLLQEFIQVRRRKPLVWSLFLAKQVKKKRRLGRDR